ncbi:hypothetical protein CMV30_14940 [Nibricoccus aquaticus]|uniref:Uncharacterized protein n=1 Tax=Nibricoccus aquaticus TaxID=2576891 RepID=A0A290Q8V9_9BACT|nr:hypothetical protein [Nibricoccus aquaticus]ATC65145.1 hypothetical protein CMV30_14940 [Nibricoccus aquaticus]
MKHLLPLFAAATLLTSSAFADIRSYHGGFTIGVGGHHGHHRDHGHHHHSFGHHRGFGHSNYYNHGYLGLGYSSIFHPAYFASDYSSPAYSVEERTVVVQERAPKAPRTSTYAPSWTPGGGWKTHPWYRSRPSVITVPDTLNDARSSAQLQQIYGEQASSLTR